MQKDFEAFIGQGGTSSRRVMEVHQEKKGIVGMWKGKEEEDEV